MLQIILKLCMLLITIESKIFYTLYHEVWCNQILPDVMEYELSGAFMCTNTDFMG